MPWQPRVREGQKRRPAGRLDVEMHEAAQTTPALPQGRSKEKSINHPSRNRQKTITGTKGGQGLSPSGHPSNQAYIQALFQQTLFAPCGQAGAEKSPPPKHRPPHPLLFLHRHRVLILLHLFLHPLPRGPPLPPHQGK